MDDFSPLWEAALRLHKPQSYWLSTQMRKKSEELKMGVFTIAKTNFSEQLCSSVVVLHMYQP